MLKTLSREQQRTLERIQAGDDRNINPQVAAALMAEGLIERYRETSGHPPVTVTRYRIVWATLHTDGQVTTC